MRWTGAEVRRRFAACDRYYGWVVVAACFAGTFSVYGLVASFGVFLGHVVEAFGLSLARASVVFSVQSVVIYGGAALLGFVVDRYSVRRLYAAGALLLGAGLYGAGQSGSVVELAVWYGVVGGTGAALLVIISFVAPPQWFTDRRGLATGVAASGTGVGTLVVPALASLLIDRFGWRGAYLALAVLASTVLLAVAVLVTEAPGGDRTGTRGGLRTQFAEAAATTRSWAFLLFLIGYGTAYAPWFAISAHLVEYASTATFGRAAGVAAISVVGAANVAGKFGVGYFSDLVEADRARVLAGCGAGMGVLAAVLTTLSSAGAVLGLAVAFGLVYGGVGALLTPVLADLFGDGSLNSLFGVASIGVAVSGAAVPYLVGTAYDLTGSFETGFLGAGTLGLLAGGAFLAANRLTN
jgi:MFS family permease